ncbi:MAG: DNA-damage-inducible protein d [Candidatus Magasanikbacteria bacterium GW2011_GWC2_40_17]|nr:MAG: DNA-damage-inducible protein d [Candidatus Magasanikbacteria bacterium GW2011_GWC2_40_17]
MKEGIEYAILTDEITRAWADRSVRDYKKFKGLKKENLRDNMTNLELVLNMLAEASTTEISKKRKPEGLENNKQVARAGGIAARKARLEIEKQTGESVITNKNAKLLKGNRNPSLPNKSSK